MLKEHIKEFWQELDEYKAEIISGGLQRLQEEFSADLATLDVNLNSITGGQFDVCKSTSKGKSVDIPITIRRPPH